MKVDVHCTTCHNSGVEARVTGIRTWSREEKKDICKISIESLIRFCDSQKKYGHDITITLLDDGSDQADMIKWMNMCPHVKVKHFKKQGSGPCTTQHVRDCDADLIVHVEDDQIYFNPYDIDWVSKCYQLLQNKDIHFLTVYAGTPEFTRGGWYSPTYGVFYNDIEFINVPYIGNCLFVTTKQNFVKLLPITLSSGEAEIEIYNKVKEQNIVHGLINIPVFVFHSHLLHQDVPENIDTTSLRRWVAGTQFGIKDMHTYFLNKRPVHVITVLDFHANTQKNELLTNYNY
jgi:hypothetical protein